MLDPVTTFRRFAPHTSAIPTDLIRQNAYYTALAASREHSYETCAPSSYEEARLLARAIQLAYQLRYVERSA